MNNNVIARKGNVLHVDFGDKTKKYILDCIDKAQGKLDPKYFLTKYELYMFQEIVNDIDVELDDYDWNFLIGLIVNTRKGGNNVQNAVNN